MKINNLILKSKFIFFLVFFSFLKIASVFGEISLYELKAEKILYKDNSETIIAEGNAQAKDQYGKSIFSDKILYNKKKSIISTYSNSIFFDTKGNKLFADSFLYDLNSKNIIADKNVQYIDNLGNVFKFTNLEYNETTEKGIGKNLIAILTDKSSAEGSVGEFDNALGTLTVSNKDNASFFQKLLNIFSINSNFYTTCENKKKTDETIRERCPDWSLSTQETTHDKINKMVYHYGTVIKIKNIPVFYTPYFSHPDPTVKRKSGLLPPSTKTFTYLGRTIKTPYFYVIDDNKDLTFTPTFYLNENSVFLAEYRQQNLNSKFYIDTSYNEGYKNLNKIDSEGNKIGRTDGSRNHFFFNFLGSYNDLIFNKNDLEINIQRISQRNYLSIHQINTVNIRQDITNLNNNITLNSYENNKKLTVGSNIYENLNEDNKNLKYQYILPFVGFSNFFNKYNQSINFQSNFEAKNTGGDSNQTYINNKIDTVSDTKIYNYLDGLTNTLKTSANNTNYYNQNIAGSKENFSSNNQFTAALENSYPLIKTNNNNEQIITPKILTKFTTGSMNDIRNASKMLMYEDIYSLNRTNSVVNNDTGASLGYGIDYSSQSKNSNNIVYSKQNLSIGQVLRINENKNMPSNSTLSEKKSAFVGSATIYLNTTATNEEIASKNKHSNIYNIKYDYTISNNLNKILKNQLTTSLTLGTNTITSNYYETHDISNEHYVDFGYTKKIIENLNFSFGARKNLQDKFTESNYFETSYDSDCLKVSLNLTKKFYSNNEIKPSNNLIFLIELKPFASPIAPNLSSFLK